VAEIDYRTRMPEPDAFLALFETTGWNEEYRATSADLARALGNSWYVLSAYDGDRLVGFGRVVCDGVLHAMIFDLIVHPTYEGRGTGSEILRRLTEKCRTCGIRDVQLFSARGKQSFYERHGFRARPADAPGMQLGE
jgi:GNAT superfamily N-acetyltransferase